MITTGATKSGFCNVVIARTIHVKEHILTFLRALACRDNQITNQLPGGVLLLSAVLGANVQISGQNGFTAMYGSESGTTYLRSDVTLRHCSLYPESIFPAEYTIT